MIIKHQHRLGLVSWCLVVAVSAQYDYVSECPAENGFFADALQCDRYYQCEDGEVSEHFCPDGLVFDESSTAFGKCGFPFSVDCTGREDLQPAQRSAGCPRANGYFAHPDETVCDKFNFCSDGVAHTQTCAGGLIFDPSKGQCDYADQSERPGCTSSALYEFSCPASSPHEHTRHSHPDNCDQFYLCIAGRARRQSCSPGNVFNPVSLSCEDQERVEGPCSRFYNSTFLESLTTPAPLNPALSANRLASQDRRRPVRPARPLNRQPQPQSQLPPEQIPQQLLDLQNFGQSSPGVRSRVPPSLPRRQQDQFQSGRIQPEEKESFFNNLRGSISQTSQTRDQQPTRTFTRPPLRRPAAPAPVEDDTPRFVAAPTPAPSSGSGFGRRRQPIRQRQRAETPDLLSQVEAELLRRDQQEKEVQEELLRREQQQREVQAELLRREKQQKEVQEELLRRDQQQEREVQAELLRREKQQKEVQEELLRREQQKKEVQAEFLRREQQQMEVQAELQRREQQKKEVEAELLRREQQQTEVEAELERRREQAEANLGPSDLDSLLSRRRPSRPARPSLPSRSSLRRAPVSRGGVGLQQRGEELTEARRGAARGRLEVLDIRRPPLQPQPEEDQADFETNFNSFRQRNSG